jgi:hypothetical protein
VRTRLAILALGLLATASAPLAQSDLDDLMKRVLARRDDNWKKLQQYILEEKQTFAVTGPGGARLFGGQQEYLWFPRDGFFIQSPTRIDGVEIGEAERRRQEDRFLRREQARERRLAEIRKTDPDAGDTLEPPSDVGDVLRQSVAPEFVRSAYFLRFKFDQGRYALVGREKLLTRDALRIEYYPTKLFADNDDNRRLTREEREKRDAARKERLARETERQRERRERNDARGDQIEGQMNKVAKATLWVDPLINQILQYQLHNMDMDFLPGRSMLRMDELNASMRMAQPFPDVWLPDSLEVNAGMTTALGRFSARYDVKYSGYRLATATARIK